MQIDLAYTGPILGAAPAALQAHQEGYGGLWTSETKHDPFLTLTLASRACPEITVMLVKECEHDRHVHGVVSPLQII